MELRKSFGFNVAKVYCECVILICEKLHIQISKVLFTVCFEKMDYVSDVLVVVKSYDY